MIVLSYRVTWGLRRRSMGRRCDLRRGEICKDAIMKNLQFHAKENKFYSEGSEVLLKVLTEDALS